MHETPTCTNRTTRRPRHLAAFWYGKSREARVAKDKGEKNPAFVISGSYSKWKKVVMAQLDLIQALMTGQLKLKGNMVMIMKNVKAAQEIVRACTRIDTEFEM